MYNRNYYLVSPRVDGVTTQRYLEVMFEQHIVMMGWGSDNKIGADFINLNKGDVVIVALRVNWVFKYYFAGIIDDEKALTNEDGILCRKLRGFIDLRGHDEDYLADASFASMSVIKAMMNINPSNNPEVIKRLDRIIAMQEKEDYLNSLVSLLKSNYNLILTGAPGTGKTYLAKEIAKKMGAKCKLVQFHPSYDYTDFVEGLRPIKKGDELGFERKDGVFKAFCKRAINTQFNNGNNEGPITEEMIKEQFYTLWDDIKDERIETIPLSSGKNSLRMIVDNNNETIHFSSKDNSNEISEGNDVTINDIIKIIIENNITTIKALEEVGPKRVGLGVGGNTTNKWAVCKYILGKIHNDSYPLQPYVFIIDEINRGEISKIFGELFYSIDSGYRGEKGKVDTQYQNLILEEDVFRNGFYVPENVYIIGTMNDIDRSVESMDFAMRRRFAWKEITAKSRQSMLDDEEAWNGNKPMPQIIDEIKIRMNNLNACIIDEYGDEELSTKDKIGLSKAYQIGASYFLKYGLYGDFDELWNNHLEGLLYEYLRGATNIETKIERLHKAYNDTVAH